MAHPMYLGKPVIATNYSGNLEFMNRDNSLLLDYTITESREDSGPYGKGHAPGRAKCGGGGASHAVDLRTLIAR